MRINHESGQAIVEMTISLVGLSMFLLVFIYMAGYSITNVEALIQARTNAEAAAAAGYGGKGERIASWQYTVISELHGTVDEEGNAKAFTVPFGASDYPITHNVINDEIFRKQLVIPAAMPNSDECDAYCASASADNLFIVAANLAVGKGDEVDDEVYTMQKFDNDARFRKKLDHVMTFFFGLNPAKINVTDQRANEVYLPVIINP